MMITALTKKTKITNNWPAVGFKWTNIVETSAKKVSNSWWWGDDHSFEDGDDHSFEDINDMVYDDLDGDDNDDDSHQNNDSKHHPPTLRGQI